MALVVTLAAAAAVGLAFDRIGIPGGLLTGAMVGAAGVTLARGGAGVVVPGAARTAAFVVLGAVIGTSLTRETVAGLRGVLLPAVFAALLLIAAGVGIALLLRATGLAPAGDVLATSPGALSAITAAAIERGVGAAEVAVFHTVRVVLVLLSLPALLTLLPDGGG